MSENTYANEADVWSLVAGCVAAYLKTLKTHHFWGDELATFGGNSESKKCARLARVIWVLGVVLWCLKILLLLVFVITQLQ